MRDEQAQKPDFDPGPPLDDRAVARAVRRGVVRTAIVALGWLIVLSLVGQIISGGLQRGFGREERYLRVVVTGLSVAHPDYQLVGWGCCNTTLLTLSSGPLSLEPLSPQPLPIEVTLEPTQNVFGHLDPETVSVPHTALGQAILDTPFRSNLVESQLRTLPPGLVASAVITFRHPFDQSELHAFQGRWQMTPWRPILFATGPPSEFEQDPYPWIGPVGWKGLGTDTTIAGFRTWTAALTEADDVTLGILGLPGAATLQELATQGAVGVVLGTVKVSTLRRMLEDPDVAAVRVGEATFDVAFGGDGGYDARG